MVETYRSGYAAIAYRQPVNSQHLDQLRDGSLLARIMAYFLTLCCFSHQVLQIQDSNS